MRDCPICWARRRISDRRTRLVTEFRMPDGSVQRTDVSMKQHRAMRPAWPEDGKFLFTSCVVGRRAARRTTPETVHREIHQAFVLARRGRS